MTELQERLLRVPDVYENGSTSGRYDATLAEAVARFQIWYGVRGDEDGVYGDDTPSRAGVPCDAGPRLNRHRDVSTRHGTSVRAVMS